jgi:hypothetical protein
MEVISRNDISKKKLLTDSDSYCFSGELFSFETNNYNCVLLNILCDGMLLRFASEELRDNQEIVIAAVKQNPMAIKFASDRVKLDETIINTALMQNGDTLKFLSESLQNNINLIKLSLYNCSEEHLKFIAKHIKSNRELTLQSLEFNTSLLKYIDDIDIINDEDIVFTAINRNIDLLEYVVNNVPKFKYLIQLLHAVNEYSSPVYHLKFGLGKLVLEDQTNYTIEFDNFGRKIIDKKFKKICIAAKKLPENKNQYATYDVNDELFKFISTDIDVLRYANQQIRNNRILLNQLINKDPRAIKYASNQLKQDKELVLLSIEKNGLCLKYIDNNIDLYRGYVLLAVEKNGMALEYATEDLKDDYDIVLKAILSNIDALRFASLRIKDLILHKYNTNGIDELNIDQLCELQRSLIEDDSDIFIPDHFAWKAEDDYGTYLENVQREEEEYAKNGFNYCREYLTESYFYDKQIDSYYKSVLKSNGLFLRKCHARHKRDKQMVLTAVTNNGWALSYADSSFRNDIDIVTPAIKSNIFAKIFVNDNYIKKLIMMSEK